jgi:hypothetical protein
VAENPVEVGSAPRLAGPALIIAILAVALWAGFAILLALNAGNASEVLWSRLGFVFASIEAVAFGAAGALWGVSIQRERAEKAEAAAARNSSDAAKGQALATAVLTDAEPSAEPGADQVLGAGAADVAERHARLARALFPDA